MVNTKWVTDSTLVQGYLMYAISPEANPLAIAGGYGAKDLLYIADDASFAHDLFASVAVRNKFQEIGDTFDVLIIASLKARTLLDQTDTNLLPQPV